MCMMSDVFVSNDTFVVAVDLLNYIYLGSVWRGGNHSWVGVGF